MARRRRPPRPGALTELPPLKILSQIAILQVIYYVVASILILFTTLVAGRRFSLDSIFSWKSLRGDTTTGWMLGTVWMLNAVIGAIALLFLIARSKLVLDFALTLHFIHLVTTSLYSHSLPQNWLWWALQIASAALMTSLAVWSCQYRELRPINFGGSAAASQKDDGAGAAAAGSVDEEMGVVRGARRGRGRDGAGEYEMVGMGEESKK